MGAEKGPPPRPVFAFARGWNCDPGERATGVEPAWDSLGSCCLTTSAWPAKKRRTHRSRHLSGRFDPPTERAAGLEPAKNCLEGSRLDHSAMLALHTHSRAARGNRTPPPVYKSG